MFFSCHQQIHELVTLGSEGGGCSWLRMVSGLTRGGGSIVPAFCQLYHLLYRTMVALVCDKNVIGSQRLVSKDSNFFIKSNFFPFGFQQVGPSVLSLPLKTKWFGFSNGPNPTTQVPQIERNPPLIIGVWHCAEPQGPRVNITWQWREKRGERFFWSLIHPSPVTDKACKVGQCKDDFPQGEQRSNAAMSQYGAEKTETGRPWDGRVGLNKWKRLWKHFSRDPGPVRYELWGVSCCK